MARKRVWPSRSPKEVLHEKIVLANTSGSLETVIVECNRYKRTGLKNGIYLTKNGSSLYARPQATLMHLITVNAFGDTSSVDHTQRTCLKGWSIVF